MSFLYPILRLIFSFDNGAKFLWPSLNCPLYEAVNEGRAPAGIEYYLPLFFPETQLLIDYLPKKALILQVNNVQLAAENFWKEVNERYEQLGMI